MSIDRKLGAMQGAFVALIWECAIVLVLAIVWALVKWAIQ